MVTVITNKVEVRFILDETASMAAKRKETIDTFNQYVKSLKEDKKAAKDTLFTLTQFNSVEGARIENNKVPLVELGAMTEGDYSPAGWTPLYDAIGNTIAVDGSPSTIVVILTDGEENNSRYWDVKRLKQKIEERQGQGWTFVFLGADLSKEVTTSMAQQMGIFASNAVNFDKRNYAETFATVSGSTQSVRDSYLSGNAGSKQDFFQKS